MKHIIHTIALAIIAVIYIGCEKEDYTVNRLNAPAQLMATRGDTSVFLKWTRVEGASFYTLVRGLKVIADSLKVESYEDSSAPDTLTEYRVYAVNNQGWRSAAYAVDSGYLGIPDGIEPRVPVRLQASDNSVEGCLLSWSVGRFATSYKIYKNGTFYKEVLDEEVWDYAAPVADTEYTVYSVNRNGMSNGISVTGRKVYQSIDDYEKYDVGMVIEPWTFIQDRIGYYTEGSPTVTDEKFFDGTKSMRIKQGKIELMFDWGGVWHEGYYIVNFMAYKASGSFNIYSSFDVNETVQATSDWVRHSYRTGLLKVGNAFKVGIESKADDGLLYIDNLSIEYVKE